MTRQGCCLMQICCCFGGRSCRFCCRICPLVNESTTTRLMYILFLFLGTVVMCLSLVPKLEEYLIEYIPHFQTTCKLLNVGEKCELLAGYMAVYRLAFSLAAFFFLMSIITWGIKTSQGCRAEFHNGSWIWKFLILLGICIGAFYIPSERLGHFQIVWMYVALVGGFVFILIQLWLLIYFARSLGNKISHKVNRGGSKLCWYGVSFIITLLCYGAWGFAVLLLLSNFTSWEGCALNKIFIGVNAGLCLMLSVISALSCCKPSETHSSLLQSSIISLYVIYLTWTALSSEPREYQPIPESLEGLAKEGRDESGGLVDQKYYCGPSDATFAYNNLVLPFVGVVIMFFSVVYSSIGTSSDNAEALGVIVSSPRQALETKDGNTLCCCCRSSPKRTSRPFKIEDIGGQRILRNEWNGTVYNYSLFHVVFCLASMYIMMNITGWFRPEESNLISFQQNWATVWIKMGSSWACVLLYLIALHMSKLGRYNNQGSNSKTHSKALVTEVCERETVT